MEETGRVSLEDLLIHREWVGRVARALVSGPAADGLEQRVWLRAMTRPPRHARGLRDWLATLLRRGARDQWREDARRLKRKARAHPGPFTITLKVGTRRVPLGEFTAPAERVVLIAR